MAFDAPRARLITGLSLYPDRMLNFKFDFSGIERLKQKLTNNPAAMAEIRTAFALLYRSFVRKRFDKASKHDGTWAELAPSTIRRRRRGRGTGSPSILRDHGTMFAATNPSQGNSGIVQSLDRPLGIEVMLGGSPISTLAQYAQEGDAARNRPPRTILVDPPQEERDKMNEVAAKILTRHAQ